MAKTVMPISNNNSQHNNILDDYSNILLPVENNNNNINKRDCTSPIANSCRIIQSPVYNESQENNETENETLKDKLNVNNNNTEIYKNVNINNTRNYTKAPLYRLSVNLIKTYRNINEVYYEAKRKRILEEQENSKNKTTEVLYNDGYDDESYDYKIKLNECLNNRYIVRQRIGRGSFGQVVRAYDIEKNCDVAIKIIKSKKAFFKQAQTELKILHKLNESDPDDSWFIVRLLNSFCHKNHQCIVFEMLSYNLYDLLRNTNYHGVSLNLIRKFARQLLKSLYHLSKKDVNIIHCDLKPENILLRNPKRSAIKIIDFGSSCSSDNKMYTYLQSRFYRSPEVILGISYSFAIDMWSLGCILVEMHTGEPLFSGSNEHDQIIRFVAMFGMPPIHLLNEGTKTNQFFEKIEYNGKISYQIKPKKNSTIEDSLKLYPRTLESIIGADGNGPDGRRYGEKDHNIHSYSLFLDLLKKMLEIDPNKRIKPIEALKHRFFQDNFAQSVVKQNEKSSKQFKYHNFVSKHNNIKRPDSAPARQ